MPEPRLFHASIPQWWPNADGPFPDRSTIRKVPRLGDRTFEQAAGSCTPNAMALAFAKLKK